MRLPSNKVLGLSLASIALSPVSAFIVLCGSRLYDQRIDPIVNPGIVSGHVHTVTGGNGMNFTMDKTLAEHSTCSTCEIVEDKSNYWTPKLYYKNSTDGTFTAVPQKGDQLPVGSGNLVGQKSYYLQRRGPNNDALAAFPEGFRMLAGDAFKRSYTNDFAGQAISWHCLGSNESEVNFLPTWNCDGGLRAQVFFPQCWNGKDLDTADHKSHVSYPDPDPSKHNAYNGGSCPSGFPVHLVSLFFEIEYDTNRFANAWYDGKQPFVLAQGDPTGYGFHGDFVNGWDVNTLQKSLDINTGCDPGGADAATCQYFTTYSGDEQNDCKIPVQVHEDVYGPFSQLPGCNPVQPGPAEATNYGGPSCSRAGVIGQYTNYYTDLTKSKGWQYVGCAPDQTSNRTFPAAGFNQLKGETLESCIDFCAGKGYSYAGAEYSNECYCGNSIPAGRTPVAGVRDPCNMPCAGNSNEYCGGPNGLSVYQKCAQGGPCTNAQYHHVQ